MISRYIRKIIIFGVVLKKTSSSDRYLVPYFLKKDPPSKTLPLSHMAGLHIDCMVHVLKQSTTAGLNVFCTNYFCGKSCQQILPNSRVNVNKESIRNLARKQVKKYLKKKMSHCIKSWIQFFDYLLDANSRSCYY